MFRRPVSGPGAPVKARATVRPTGTDALRVGDYAGAEALALRHLAPPREPTLDPDAGKSPSGG
ncbi:hypothetical protein [Streptomyces sp. NBC_01803]|uniref:hypothetical protein n=1 Tax=Streptomyces sp. NBC_01803 TaxID=2975946 RepID=UPI002DDB7C94|nr:hypothetical protein [Streptomyces sp. NBC_01803]WSA43752.1 hypothetical protein OIE51_05765 [Streptomyces sp. NBC_01803]